MALLLPCFSVAQCIDDDWYGVTAALPQGVFGGSPQNQTLLRSEFDNSSYLVLEYNNTFTGIEELHISEAVVQPIPCERGKGIILQKYSDEGELYWNKNLCYSVIGLVDGITVDNSGNLYLGGYFKGDLIFDGNIISQSVDYQSYFLMKIDPQGGLIWHRTGTKSGAVGLSWTDTGLLVMLTVSDSIIYNGTTYHHPAPTIPLTRDFVLLMLDGAGDYIWHKFLSGSKNEQIHHVAYNNGKCLIQGRFEENLTYDGQTLMGSETGRLFQLSIQSLNGDFLWMKNQSNEGTAILTYGAEFLDDATFISAGFYNGSPSTFSFQGETIASSNGLTDGYIMRQDFQTGDLIWLKTLGAAGYSGVLGMDRTNAGIVLTGFFDTSELNFEGLTLVNHNGETEDPFIIVIDKDGKPQCHIEAIGTEADDRGVKVVHNSNFLYTLVSFSDSTAFGEFELEAQGLKDIALWKTCLPCDTLTSVTEAEQQKPALQLHPNPASHTIRVGIQGSKYKVQSITFIDMLGYAELYLKTTANENNINISHLANGIYTVVATTEDGETHRQSLVVQH